MASGGGRRNNSQQQNNQSSGSSAGTTLLAAIGGVAVGAGLAWLFTSGSQETPASSTRSRTSAGVGSHQTHPIRPSNPAGSQQPRRSSSGTTQLPSAAAPDSSAKEECAVCLESFSVLVKNGVEILSLGCGHIYCQDCLYNLQRQDADDDDATPSLCPKCRKQKELYKIESKSSLETHKSSSTMEKDLKQNGPASLLSQTLLEEILEPNLDEIAKNINCSYEVCHFGCGYGGGHGSYGLDRGCGGCGGGCLPGCGPCGWQPCCNQFCLDQYWGFYDPTDPHKQFRMIGGVPDGLIRCFCKPGETKPEPEENKDIVFVEEQKKRDKMLAQIKAEKETEEGEEGGSLTDVTSKTSGSVKGGGSGTSSTGATPTSSGGQFESTYGTYMMRSGPQNKLGQKALKEALERMGLADKEKEINELIDMNNNCPINQNKTLQGKPIYYSSPETESMTKRSKYSYSNVVKGLQTKAAASISQPAKPSTVAQTEDNHPLDYLRFANRPIINTSHQVLQYLNSLPDNPDKPDTHDDFLDDFNQNYLNSIDSTEEILETRRVKRYDSPLDWEAERSRNWNIYKAQRYDSPLLGGQDEDNYESRQTKISSKFRQNIELTTLALDKSTRNHSMLTRLGQGRKNLNSSRTLTPINTRAKAGCCGGQARTKPKSGPKTPKNYQKNDANGNEKRIQELEYALRTLPIRPGQTRSFAVQPRTFTYKSKPRSSGYGQQFPKSFGQRQGGCGCDELTLKKIQKNFP